MISGGVPYIKRLNTSEEELVGEHMVPQFILLLNPFLVPLLVFSFQYNLCKFHALDNINSA